MGKLHRCKVDRIRSMECWYMVCRCWDMVCWGWGMVCWGWGMVCLLLNTNLSGKLDRCLFTLRVSQLCGAFFKSVCFLRGEWELEAFLLLHFITSNFRQLNWLILTLLLWDRIAHSDASLVRAYHRHIVTNLVLYSFAVSLVSMLLLWAHLLGLLLTLGLILNLHCGGL